MAKVEVNTFNNVKRIWVRNDNNFTPDEQKFMKDAGMRASKNPKSWFCKHDDATEAVIRNFFESGADETRYEPVEDNPLIDDKPKRAQNQTGYAISTPTGEQPAVYVPVDDYAIYEKACGLATALCDGLHTMPTEETVKKWIEFYYVQLVKHARGE